MATPKILISIPTNGDPRQVYEQTVAYDAAMNGNCAHVVHVSRDAHYKNLMADNGGLDVAALPNVHVNDRHYFTARPSILGVHVMNMEYASRIGLDFDYVYLHTASDLPFRRDLDRHIAKFDFGMNRPLKVNMNKTQGYVPAIADHRPLNTLASYFGPDAPLYTTRGEGLFFTRELFFEVMWYTKVHVPFERETIWRGTYPYEEYLLPTVIEHLLGKRNLRRAANTVITTTTDGRFGLGSREELAERHIPLLENSDPGVFAFKFAPKDMASPVRRWVREQLGYELPPYA